MPLTLRKRGDTWYAKGVLYADGDRIEVKEFSTHYRDERQAREYVERLEAQRIADALRAKVATRTAAQTFLQTGESEILPKWATALWRQARHRALNDGIVFYLDEADMAFLVGRANGACEVSGIPFSTGRVSGSRHRPFAPSLDRLRGDGAYVRSNCRLVCCAVNVAMNDWGEEVLVTIAKGIIGKRRQDRGRRRAAVLPRPADVLRPIVS